MPVKAAKYNSTHAQIHQLSRICCLTSYPVQSGFYLIPSVKEIILSDHAETRTDNLIIEVPSWHRVFAVQNIKCLVIEVAGNRLKLYVKYRVVGLQS